MFHFLRYKSVTLSACLSLALGLLFPQFSVQTYAGTNGGTTSLKEYGKITTRTESNQDSLTATEKEPNSEYQALADLYKSTNGIGWVQKDNWLTGDSPCGWYGVTCNDSGQVVQLQLPRNQLIGPIPSSLAALTSLQLLDLSDNQLNGSIPDSFSALKNLKRLVLIYNQLSGSIPSSLSVLKNLEFVYLSHNQLSGSIPDNLSALTNLINLYLGSNQLSGSIPSSLSALTNLQALDLSENQLSGPLPDNLSGLRSLKRLALFYNQLSGSLPASLATLPNLEYLHLAYNQFSGSIPDTLLVLSKLNTFNLNNNQLSGSIPDNLSALTNLEYMDFSYNQFSGSIPASLGAMLRLRSCELNNNQLSGCLPAALAGLCGRGVTVVLSGNPDLADGGDFGAFCSKGVGRCDPQSNMMSFWLMNAETGLPMQQLTDGTELNLTTLLTRQLNIQAITSPTAVDSVVFVLAGRQNLTQTEREAPYSLFKDTNGIYRSWTPSVGSYQLTATPYTSLSGVATAGAPLSLTFTVVELPRVLGFKWVNCETGEILGELHEGDVVDLTSLPTRNLNILVNTGPATGGSMMLELSGQEILSHIESKAPYTLAGNTGGSYRSWIPKAGSYQLKATPYAGAGGSGTAGTPFMLNFTVVDVAPMARRGSETNAELLDSQVLYYPNPFQESFTLKIQGVQQQPVRIYDLSGRLVYQRTDSPAEQRIDLDQKVGAGMYVLQVGDGPKAKRYKLIKVR
ncbi:putative secreted protein (Por secretion system target) [Larkinella arboricola]|uniref:Putative secreted protein (Por secretion system target) n=1 Tax=Larkinella arboricola TaxID=643671 RepID=A0A327X4W9_LARAB|nr:T9SS type A sorting domain-containing protein [Larkinella arboricola]RAK00123.1 putative secreted protein (Por secretion system target) [Larkinella arboricola]